MAQFFRTLLNVNDPDRNWNVVWERGDVTGTTGTGFFNHGEQVWQDMRLVGGQTSEVYEVPSLVWRQSNFLEHCYYRAWRLPDTCKPGVYSVQIAGREQGRVKVLALSKPLGIPMVGTISSGFTLRPGYNHVGYGATVINCHVNLQPNSGLIGIHFVDCTVHGQSADAVVKDCTFTRCHVGGAVDWSNPRPPYTDHGVLYQSNEFIETTVNGVCSGCFLNNRFSGRVAAQGLANSGGANGHNFVNERASRLCMINNTFDSTDRGPILRNAWGESSRNLYVGTKCLNISDTDNGGEVLCVEGESNPFNGNILLGWRAFNCNAPLQIWNTEATGNVIATAELGSGCFVSLSGIKRQHQNTIRDNLFSHPVKENVYGTGATGTIQMNNRMKER